MNFRQLYDRLVLALAEGSTPAYWTETELKMYLNEAALAFVADSKIQTRNAPLDRAEEDNNSWFLPKDLIAVGTVSHLGRPLVQTTPKQIARKHSGMGYDTSSMGEGYPYRGDWRAIIGTPTQWFLEDNMVKLFPRISGGPRRDTPRKTIGAIWPEGVSIANLPVKIPFKDKALIDVFVNGVHESVDNWELIDSLSDPNYSAIQFNWNAFDDTEIEVVYQDTPVMATKRAAVAYDGTNTYTFSDFWYEPLTDSLRVVLNGVTIKERDYTATVTAPGEVEVTIAPPVYEGVIEVTMFRRQPVDLSSSRISDNQLTMEYVYRPLDMEDDEDIPEIPSVYHEAIWQYAAWAALAREGEETRDIQKANIYRAMYTEVVKRAMDARSVPIELDYRVVAPFVF